METDVAPETSPEALVGAAGTERSAPFADVFADVAHSLRNHFHRLYYWMDLLGGQALDDEGRSALESAAHALRSIETLTAGTVTLVRDLDLARIAMAGAELVHCIGQSLERQGATVRLDDALPESASVSLDASHVSRTIEIVGARLGATQDRPIAVDLRAETDDEGWVVVTLHAHGTTDTTDDDVERMLEWAQAERVLRAHGGNLLWEAASAQEHRAVLILPAA